MCEYVKINDEFKCTLFLSKNERFFNIICNKISIIMQKGVEKETVCNGRYLNTKKIL